MQNEHAQADKPDRAKASSAPTTAVAKATAAIETPRRHGEVLLVAWGTSHAADWVPRLAYVGYQVAIAAETRTEAFQWVEAHHPRAVVIDLSHNPDDGKRLGSTLRVTPSTAAVPIVFCDASGSGMAALNSADAVITALARL